MYHHRKNNFRFLCVNAEKLASDFCVYYHYIIPQHPYHSITYMYYQHIIPWYIAPRCNCRHYGKTDAHPNELLVNYLLDVDSITWPWWSNKIPRMLHVKKTSDKNCMDIDIYVYTFTNAHRLQKLICLCLSIDCFMKICFQSSSPCHQDLMIREKSSWNSL